METGFAFLQNLLEIVLKTPRGEDSPCTIKRLHDDLSEAGDSLFATLLGLTADQEQTFQKTGNQNCKSPLLSTKTKEQINLTALAELVNNEKPASEMTPSLNDIFLSQSGIKGSICDSFFISHSIPKYECCPLNTGLEFLKTENSKTIELFPEPGLVASNTNVNSNPKTQPQELTTNLEGSKGKGTNGEKSLLTGIDVQKKDILEDSPQSLASHITKNRIVSLDLNRNSRVNVLSGKHGILNELDSKILSIPESGTLRNEKNATKTGMVSQKTLTDLSEFNTESSKTLIRIGMQGTQIKAQHAESVNKADEAFEKSASGLRMSDAEIDKSGADVQKISSILKGEHPDPSNVKKVTPESGDNIEKMKIDSEVIDKVTKTSLESGLKERGVIEINQSGAEVQKISSILKGEHLDPSNVKKVTPESWDNIEKLKIDSEVIDKETQLRSESGHQKNGEGNSKGTEESSKNVVLCKNYGTDVYRIKTAFKMTESVTDDAKIDNKEKCTVEKENHLNPEKGEKDRFTKGFVKEISSTLINSVTGQKYLNLRTSVEKPEITSSDIGENRVVKMTSANGENTLLSSNHQNADRSLEALVQTKNIPTIQKPLQTDVLNQLVEKSVMSLKNGQTSILISLKPEVLGHLRMQIATENNHVMIKIMTEVPMVKEIIENNVSHLRAELLNHGLEIDKFDVSVNYGSNPNEGTQGRLPFRRFSRKAHGKKREENIVEVSGGTIGHIDYGKGETLINFFA